MASDIFEDDKNLERPTVQIGDPFKEKLLLEACLELFDQKGIVGIQDMGAAGLTSSASEMASRSGNGILIDLDDVPKRDLSINAYEMLLSESQERMLLVLKEKSEKKINKIFTKWGLDSKKIGSVIKEKKFIIKYKKEIVVDLPVSILTDDCPIYKRPVKNPMRKKIKKVIFKRNELSKNDLKIILKKIISDPNICSRKWIYEQYDHMVGTDTIVRPGSDSAVVRIKNSKKALCLTTNCNSGYCLLNPSVGASIAVAESTRNIIASGGKPLAITNCLNFGNPENREIMWQFSKSIEGISKACKNFNTPVVSGNVSLYNENAKDSIKPTPVISMVGILDNIKFCRDQFFKNINDEIYLVGKIKNDFGNSIISKYYKKIKDIDSPPYLNLKIHKKINNFIYKINRKLDISSVHDISEGGLAVALLESCFGPNLSVGVKIDLSSLKFSSNLQIFSESQGCYILSCGKDSGKKLLKFAEKDKIYIKKIGVVSHNNFYIKDYFNVKIDTIHRLWSNSFPK